MCLLASTSENMPKASGGGIQITIVFKKVSGSILFSSFSVWQVLKRIYLYSQRFPFSRTLVHIFITFTTLFSFNSEKELGSLRDLTEAWPLKSLLQLCADL